MHVELLKNQETITTQAEGRPTHSPTAAIRGIPTSKSLSWYLNVLSVDPDTRISLLWEHGPDGLSWLPGGSLYDSGGSDGATAGFEVPEAVLDVTKYAYVRFVVMVQDLNDPMPGCGCEQPGAAGRPSDCACAAPLCICEARAAVVRALPWLAGAHPAGGSSPPAADRDNVVPGPWAQGVGEADFRVPLPASPRAAVEADARGPACGTGVEVDPRAFSVARSNAFLSRLLGERDP